ncbi:hypothetical protein HanIR_Chr03g0122341 [Helianthus annuus]|nr:hypothetical protein HanIR_Chr03g0122341 [Helianthus annuus]
MFFHLNFFFRSNSILSNTMIVSTKSQQNKRCRGGQCFGSNSGVQAGSSGGGDGGYG